MPTILLANIIYRQISTKPPPVMGVKQQVIHISTLFITLIRAYMRIKENLHGGDQHAKMHIPPPRPPIRRSEEATAHRRCGKRAFNYLETSQNVTRHVPTTAKKYLVVLRE